MKAKNTIDEHEQWRNRILRALAELRGDEHVVRGSSRDDGGAPASETGAASSRA